MMPTLGTALEIDLGRPVHPGCPRQLTGYDATHADCRLESPPGHLAPQRIEQPVAGECDATTDDDYLRIEDIQQIGNTDAEELGRVVHHFERELVSIVRGLIYRLGRDLPEVTSHIISQPAHRARLELLHRAHGDIGSRGIRLETPVVAALAAAALGVDRGMPDLTGAVGCSVVQFAVHD